MWIRCYRLKSRNLQNKIYLWCFNNLPMQKWVPSRHLQNILCLQQTRDCCPCSIYILCRHNTTRGTKSLLLIIITTTTLFQEDTIFGTNASLTYGPQIQKHTCVWSLPNNENYLQYLQSRWGLRTSSMLRAGYPTLLAWRGRYDLSRLKTST